MAPRLRPIEPTPFIPPFPGFIIPPEQTPGPPPEPLEPEIPRGPPPAVPAPPPADVEPPIETPPPKVPDPGVDISVPPAPPDFDPNVPTTAGFVAPSRRPFSLITPQDRARLDAEVTRRRLEGRLGRRGGPVVGAGPAVLLGIFLTGLEILEARQERRREAEREALEAQARARIRRGLDPETGQPRIGTIILEPQPEGPFPALVPAIAVPVPTVGRPPSAVPRVAEPPPEIQFPTEIPAPAPQIAVPAPSATPLPEIDIPIPEVRPSEIEPETTPEAVPRPTTAPSPGPAPSAPTVPLPRIFPFIVPTGVPFRLPIPRRIPTTPRVTPRPELIPRTPLIPETIPTPTPTPTPTPDVQPTPFAPPGTPVSRCPPCESVRRRRRRKGKCREGFFRELPRRTEFITWRTRDCATQRARQTVRDILGDL